MKASILVLTLVLVMSLGSVADAGILNGAVSWREFVNSLNVTSGQFFDFEDREWHPCFLGSLYTFEIDSEEFCNLNAGYAVDHIALGSVNVKLNHPRLLGPSFSLGPLEPEVGFAGGYSYDERDAVFGPVTIGLKVEW